MASDPIAAATNIIDTSTRVVVRLTGTIPEAGKIINCAALVQASTDMINANPRMTLRSAQWTIESDGTLTATWNGAGSDETFFRFAGNGSFTPLLVGIKCNAVFTSNVSDGDVEIASTGSGEYTLILDFNKSEGFAGLGEI